MQYFSTLPKIVQFDNQLNAKVFTNILARASIKPSLLNNPILFYTYDVQDEDTPEIVAYKYYGDIYRYWIVLYTNQMMDPMWSWPLSGRNFDKYIADKYTTFNPYSTVHHYEKIITQYDVNTMTTTTNIVQITQSTYNTLVETNNTYTLPTGPVKISVTKKPVSYYDYELNLNESKRSIKILNRIYAEQFENELNNLMNP